MRGDDGNTFVTLEDLLRDVSASGAMDDICISVLEDKGRCNVRKRIGYTTTVCWQMKSTTYYWCHYEDARLMVVPGGQARVTCD